MYSKILGTLTPPPISSMSSISSSFNFASLIAYLIVSRIFFSSNGVNLLSNSSLVTSDYINVIKFVKLPQ